MRVRAKSWTSVLRVTLLAWVVLAAVITLGSVPASAQLESSAEAGLCGASKESLIWVSLSELGMGPGEHDLAFRVLYDGQELLVERYRVQIEDQAKSSALPVWLGGVAEQDTPSKEGNLRDLTVEMIHDGESIASWSLDTFLHQGSALATREATEALILERSIDEGDEVAAPIYDEVISQNQKGTIICPGAFPQCDIEYDLCEEECYLDEQCYQECSEQFDECAYGISYTFTQNTEIRRRYGGNTCAFYPWHNFFNPKKWDFWDVVYQVREYDRTLCPRTGDTFDTLIRQYNTSDTCYRKTPFSCSGNASYLGGDCRW